jgi:hypothetical protein
MSLFLSNTPLPDHGERLINEDFNSYTGREVGLDLDLAVCNQSMRIIFLSDSRWQLPTPLLRSRIREAKKVELKLWVGGVISPGREIQPGRVNKSGTRTSI